MDDIEQRVERKIDKKLLERSDSGEPDREAVKQEIINELKEEQAGQRQGWLETMDTDSVSRRSFLKMLGLGTGGLALASSASADFGQVLASTQGTSDIDADTVDGNQASDFATANDLYTNEEVQDTVASFVNSDSNLSWSYDDANNTLTASLSNSISVNTLEATTSITGPADNTVTDFVGDNLTLDSGTLKAITGPDVRTSLNDLFVRNAKQDFELGLTQLDYRDGQFEVFANDSKIANSSNLSKNLGSPLNGNGYVVLQDATTGNFSGQNSRYDASDSGFLPTGIDITPNYVVSAVNKKVIVLNKNDLTFNSEYRRTDAYVVGFAVDKNAGMGYAIYDNDGVLVRFDLDTGSEDLSKKIASGSSYSSVTVVAGNVYCGIGDQVYVLDKNDFSQIENEYQGGGFESSQLENDGERPYVGDLTNDIFKLNPSNAKAITEESEYEKTEVFTISGEYIYSAGTSGIAEWDKSNMSTINTAEISIEPDDIAVGKSRVYISDHVANQVTIFDRDTLTQVDKFDSQGSECLQIAVDEGIAYSGARDASLTSFGEGITTKTNGNVQHVQQDIGFTPSTAVLSDDLRQLPTNTNVYYEIADDAGNVVTVQRSDIDGEVDVSALNSSVISTTANLERPNTDTSSPELDSWAVYFN